MTRVLKLATLCIMFCFCLEAQQKTITIWVHGTMPNLIVPKFAKKSFFHLDHGLVPIASYNDKDQLYKIAKALTKSCSKQFDIDHYYTFGWSGKLCFTERKKAAQELYQNIVFLQESYKTTYGDLPYIRIITHSHGGNVVLNLAKVKKQDDSLTIDELILLACPVQEKTKHLIADDCFNKVYSFYSGGDTIQILDPQGLYPKSKTKKLFSDRTFDHHVKLRQSQVKINGRSLMHIEFLWTNFLKYLPALCQEIDHFYRIIVPSQITYEKILDVRSKDDQVYMRRKLKPA